MASRGRGRRGRPRGTSQAPPAFDQEAFAEAIGISVATIAQTCAIVNQGGLNDFQRLEAHLLLMVRGGVDSRVMTTMTTEGQEQIQFVSPYPSMGQRDQCQFEGAAQAPSTSQTGHIGQSQSAGRGLGQDLQVESSGQAGQMTCYHYR